MGLVSQCVSGAAPFSSVLFLQDGSMNKWYLEPGVCCECRLLLPCVFGKKILKINTITKKKKKTISSALPQQ